MLRFKHLRLDQEKIEKVRRILNAKTETEAMDRALDKVIQEDQERLRRMKIMKRMVDLRKSLGKMKEDSSEWIKEARKERDLSCDVGS